MTTTGKAARRRHGTRVAAKRAKERRPGHKAFGHLPVSVARGNAQAFNDQTALVLPKGRAA